MAFDEQDDLNKWLQSQDSPNLTPQSATQAPAAEGGGVWSKARDMMDRQAQMQYQPQDYSKFLGKPEAAPDRTGNDFRTILAMALDLFGNKGRGAGQLMQAGNQSFDAKDAAWKKENGPQAQLARQMQVKQLEGADRAAFNNDRAVAGQQIGQEMQMAGAQSQQQNQDRTFAAGRDDHDDAQAQQQLQRQVQEEQFGATQGQAKTFHDDSMNMQRQQLGQSAAQAAAARAQAAAFHTDDNEQHFNDQNQQLDMQRDQFQQQKSLQEMQNQGARDKYQLEHPQAVLPEGYTASNPQLFSQAAKSPQLMDDYTTKMATYGKVKGAMDTLVSLQTAPSSAANKRSYDSAMKLLIGDKSKEGSTGALTNTEYARYLSDLPEYGELVGPGWRGVRDAFTGEDNSAVKTLRQMQGQMAKSHANDLAPYGIVPADFTQQQGPDPSLVSRYPGLKLVP